MAILVQLTFASGLSFYNHAIYLNALAEQPAFSVSTASLAVSVFFLSGGVAGLGVGKWVQLHDPRYSISCGAILSCIAVSSLPFVSQLWQLLLVYALFGVGFAASALLPATTLVTRWFHRRRAIALSIASTGLSLGGVLLTPLSAVLVSSLGFNGAAPVLGLLYLVGILPVAWIWLRPSPESMGLRVDGDAVIAESGAESHSPAQNAISGIDQSNDASQGINLTEARRGKLFWAICLAYVFVMLAQVGGIAHQYGLVRETLTEAQTVIAVAILPVASIVGRLAGGWLVGQISIRAFAICMMVFQVVALVQLAIGSGMMSLSIGLFVFGASVGNLLMLQPLLIAEAFGVKDYARLFSISNLMSSWGTAAGPALLGFTYAASGGDYTLPYLFAAAAGLFGLGLFLLGGPLHPKSTGDN